METKIAKPFTAEEIISKAGIHPLKVRNKEKIHLFQQRII